MRLTVAELLHVGFHKTGTTALQRHLFPALPDTVALAPGRRRSLFRALTDHLLDADDGGWLPNTLRALLTESQGDATHLVVSREGFSGSPLGGGRDGGRAAARLRQVLPDARILIVVRHQATMIRSLYSQYVQSGGYAGFATFVEGSAPHCRFDPDHLRYDRLVHRYRELFDPDRVHVIAYEDLVADPAGTLHTLVTLLDPALTGAVDGLTLPRANRSLSRPSRLVVRATNRLARRSDRNPNPLFPVRRAAEVRDVLERVDRRLLSRAGDALAGRDAERLRALLTRYQTGNAELATMTGLSLDALGYPLPAVRPRAAAR